MERAKHLLSRKDPETMTGECVICGPVSVKRQSNGSLRCLEVLRREGREGNRRRLYGVSVEDYALLLSVQDGLCAICTTPYEEAFPLHVDHDHATGRVRGLLCFSCNSILGNARDSREVLEAAIYYLWMYEPAKSSS